MQNPAGGQLSGELFNPSGQTYRLPPLNHRGYQSSGGHFVGGQMAAVKCRVAIILLSTQWCCITPNTWHTNEPNCLINVLSNQFNTLTVKCTAWRALRHTIGQKECRGHYGVLISLACSTFFKTVVFVLF